MTASAALPAIVLVDDEAPYTELMTQMLEFQLGCPVHGFLRPDTALEALPTLDAAVIITDYHMPVMDGITLIEKAHALAPGVASILISGNNLDDEKPRMARTPSLRSFLEKPVSWRTLAEETLRIWPEGRPAPKLRG